VTSTVSNAVVTATANIAGSTGVTISAPPSQVTLATPTPAGDGSNTAPNFRYWSGTAAASAAQLATNIAASIATAVGVMGSSPSAGEVLITAATGTAGNGFTVSTTIGSGLSGAAFNGSLSGGASGTTSGTTFSTSMDSTNTATNVAAHG